MKKIKFLVTIIGLFAIVLTVVACQTTASAEEAYVTIDINPSVELIVNGREEVVYVNALNEDAEVLLADLDLVGMPVDEATDLIIETAIALGYIDIEATDTVVQVSTLSDSALGEQIRERVKESINNAFQNRGIYGRAANKGYTEEFLAEAESYGVTPAFLAFAKAVVEVQDEVTLEDALLMTQEELRDILKDAREANLDVLHELRDDFQADRQAIHDEYDPQIEAVLAQITALETNIASVEDQIAAEPSAELEAELATLQGNLESLQADLQTLLDDMHAELEALREAFHTQSEELMPNIMARVVQRRSQYRNTVQNWLRNHGNGNMKDAIAAYQQQHQDDDEEDTTE